MLIAMSLGRRSVLSVVVLAGAGSVRLSANLSSVMSLVLDAIWVAALIGLVICLIVLCGRCAERAIREEIVRVLDTGERRSEVGTLLMRPANMGPNDMTDHSTSSITDAQLAEHIRQAIYLDERLSEQPIDVSVQDAVVQLTGTVQSHRRRLVAVEIANSFVGCLSVDDKLGVDPPADLPDEEISDNVRVELAAHADIAKSTVSVTVEAGVVTLSGAVRTQWERIEAEDVALGAEGVRSVKNMLLVDPPGQFEDREIGRAIKTELVKELGVAANAIRVAFAADTAVLSGAVEEAWHREKADEVARRCRIVHLRNEIQVVKGGARS